MITGTVNVSREARIPLRLLGSNGVVQDIEAVIDTGFDGFLTLPSAALAALSSPRIGALQHNSRISV
jgi:predicted aspartyl protease